jgi:hypothetical protein
VLSACESSQVLERALARARVDLQSASRAHRFIKAAISPRERDRAHCHRVPRKSFVSRSSCALLSRCALSYFLDSHR